MKKILSFFILSLSILSLICTQECTFINTTYSNAIVTVSYRKLTDKACVQKVLYLMPQQKEVITETQKDCLPYHFVITTSDGKLSGKSCTYEALLPLSDSFVFNILEGPDNTLSFDIKK
jgi:hypothetical protein